MRRLRYGVAMSLDGFIAGPNGEYDWIMPDPGIDFAAIYARSTPCRWAGKPSKLPGRGLLHGRTWGTDGWWCQAR